MTDVYYTISDEKANPYVDPDNLYAVPKDYFDEENELSDQSPDYPSMSDALFSINCEELGENLFSLEITEEELIEEMYNLGFNMIRNDDIL